MRKRAWLGIAFAAAATPALAQLGGGAGRRGNRGKPSEEQGKGGAQEPQADMLEVTLHEFQEDLKLSPAQEPAWESYLDKVRALATDIARERSRARSAAQENVLQRIDRAVDAARDRLTALEDIAQSAKALYAGLSADQQRIADPRLANIMSIPLAAGASPRR
jgi:periplasmic protein CpxP/Spy